MSERKPLSQLSVRQLYRRAAESRELIKQHDFDGGDALIAAGLVGASLVAALALRAAKKRGNKVVDQGGQEVTIVHGPAHYMRRAVSFVKKDGEAGSFPDDIEQAQHLHDPQAAADDVSIFRMEPGGETTYDVNKGTTESPQFRGMVRYGADLALRALHLRPSRNPEN